MSNNREVGVTNRAELQFVGETQTALHFLVEELGFRLVKCEPPTFVRYESNELFINVYHGRLSYEIDVEIGRLSDPYQRRYCIADVLGAILGWEDKSRTYFQASNQKALRGCIQVIADLVAKHYRPILACDLTYARRMASPCIASQILIADLRSLLKGSTTDFVNISHFFREIFHRPTPVTPLY